MENVSMIAAIGKNNELGKDNDLIWRFHEDMQFFKENTIDKTIVMGMNTLKSLPGLLPRRKHVVLTRNAPINLSPKVEVISSIDDLLEYIDSKKEEIMIIGGASLYKQMLEYANKLILTEIEATCCDADVYFPSFNRSDWDSELLGECKEDDIKFKHLIYTRKKERVL